MAHPDFIRPLFESTVGARHWECHPWRRRVTVLPVESEATFQKRAMHSD